MSSEHTNPDDPGQTGTEPVVPPSEPGNLPESPDVVPQREGEDLPGQAPAEDKRISIGPTDLA